MKTRAGAVIDDRPTKKRKTVRDEVFQLGEENKIEQAKKIIHYAQTETRLRLAKALLGGLAKNAFIDSAYNFIHNGDWEEKKKVMVKFFIRRLMRNEHYKEAEKFIQKYGQPEHYSLRNLFLVEVAKKGLLDTGLEYLEEEMNSAYNSHCYMFVMQLVRHGHAEKAQQFLKKIPEPLHITMLTEAFVTGLAQADNTEEAENYIQLFYSSGWHTRYELRKRFISVLAVKGFVDLAAEYIKSLPHDDDVDYHGVYVKYAAEFDHRNTAISYIIDNRHLSDQANLLQIFLEWRGHELKHEKANLKLMLLINDEELNQILTDKIAEEQGRVYAETLLRKANKFIAIGKRYALTSFKEIEALANMQESARMWILGRNTLFAQKGLPANVVNQVTQNMLDLSEQHTENVMQSVQKYHG